MLKYMYVTKFVDYFFKKIKAKKFNITSAILYFEDESIENFLNDIEKKRK